MKVLFLAPYPKHRAPNQRFRFEQYLDFLEASGLQYEYHSFWSEEVWQIFYLPGHYIQKFTGLLSGMFRRLLILTRLSQFDFVFIHRESAPIGPPVLEFLIARIWRKKIIYDFDDAIWIRNYSNANKGVARWLKWHRKVPHICRMSYRVSTGNNYLAEYARQHNNQVTVVPTTIDTEGHHNRIKPIDHEPPLVVGWTGTHSTIPQLRSIENELRELQRTFPFKLLVICNDNPNFDHLDYEYRHWQFEREIEDLLEMDIGIMPLLNSEWEKGKCGFKALQYMSLGIPVVASAVGANCDILTHEKEGFLVPFNHPQEWIHYLSELLQNPNLRQEMGEAGRQNIKDRYSVEANKKKYLTLFS